MERYRGDELKLGDVSLSIGLERLDFHIERARQAEFANQQHKSKPLPVQPTGATCG